MLNGKWTGSSINLNTYFWIRNQRTWRKPTQTHGELAVLDWELNLQPSFYEVRVPSTKPSCCQLKN